MNAVENFKGWWFVYIKGLTLETSAFLKLLRRFYALFFKQHERAKEAACFYNYTNFGKSVG